MSTIAAGVGVTAVGSSSVAAADVIHVSPSGDDAGSGSAANPVRTVQQAVRLADGGDSIEIASGRYHEQVQVYSKQVHLRAAAGADVVFDGAVEINGWTAQDGRWWAPWSTDFERSGVPYTTEERPEAGWPEQFFLGDRNLREVAVVGAVAPGTFFYDRSARRVWIADDPTGRDVAGSALNWGLYLNLADGSSVSGITVERYATQTRNMAAVRAYADDLVLDDLVVRDNARIGVSVIGDRVRLDDIDAIDNGHLGVHAHRSSALTVSAAFVSGNNSEDFDPFHSAGGLKVTESTGLIVTGSTVVDNAGPGVWTDLDTSDVVVASNWITGNGRSGVEIELSSDVIVVDNTVHDNGEAGVWVLESSQVDVWHNSLLHNVRDVWILDGPRSDVNDVTVGNNVLGGDAGPGAVSAILNVDDWTEERNAAAMNVQLQSNRYWLVPGAATTAVSRWANWPQSLSIASTVEAHRAGTGQGVSSDLTVSPTDPFSRSGFDTRQPADAATGVVAPARVVAVMPSLSAAQAPGPLTAPTVDSDSDSDSGDVGSGPAPQPQPEADTGPVVPPSTDSPAFRAPKVLVELGQVIDHRDIGGARGSLTGIGAASRSGASFMSL